MGYLVKQGDSVNQGLKQYYLDTVEELNEINVDNCVPGTIAYIINTGEVYMLTNKKEWKVQ